MTDFPKVFVTTVDVKIAEKLNQDLQSQGFEMTRPPYTIFSGKKKGVSCTLYQSGKLMVQGKEMKAFIEFYLEPEILGRFDFTYQTLDIDKKARIGIDESGKGDFFGPLCIAGVYAEGDAVIELKSLGVKDSKLISDQNIKIIGTKIKAKYAHHIVRINPLKYNELILQFKNLNKLLAWGHATTIEYLVAKTNCKRIFVDQFADESVVRIALERKKLSLQLFQRHRAEEDLVVAAASILARQAFLEGLEKLGQDFSIVLPKGASAKTIAVGKAFIAKYGREAIANVGKIHFKTLDSILS